jgi:thiamine-phosphate pyrophosphorylase
MLVSDRTVMNDGAVAEALIEAAGDCVTAVQLREKDLPAAELLDIARRLKGGLPELTLLIVNDRVDVALAAGAEGVQLGAGSLSVKEVRRIAPDLLVGASIHSVDEAMRAEQDGADYLVVGTMFASRSHPGKEPEGLGLMREIRARTRLPLIGIGGITTANAASVMAAGADGVAVITEILAAKDPADAARRLWRALQ